MNLKVKSLVRWFASTLLTVVIVTMVVWLPALAQTLSLKQANSLQSDGTTVSSVTGGAFWQLAAGYDGTLVQALAVDASGQLQVDVLTTTAETVTATTCTALSNTALSTTSEVVFAANTSRKKFCISNNDAAIAIHVRMGATATTSSTRVAAGQVFCEASEGGYVYQGTVDAIAASGTPAISGEECT